jgi:hypothetical protein
LAVNARCATVAAHLFPGTREDIAPSDLNVQGVGLNRTGISGGSIVLKEDGVHDRHQASPNLASLSS